MNWPDPLGDKLGSGGFASVWAVSGQRVIKIAHARHDLARARIAREAEALAAIGAPAVPAIVTSDVTDDGCPYIVMERIGGQTLADLIAAGPIALGDVLALAHGTLDALAAIHAAHFVHRDLKPANIVRKPDGTIVILDLGLARKLPHDPDDPTRANVQVGSLEYMPPEQLADSASVDERSDLYAFGCVLYALCARRPPFVGDAAALERAHAALRPPRLGALATVPAALEALTSDLLAKDRERRPPSVAAVRARLAEARAGDEPHVRSTHSISLIGHGNQPVVLVFAELPRVDRALLGLFAARRLVLVSQRGRRVLACALGGDHADPAAAAVATARDLAAAGARVALHLEALRVESAGGASTVHGDAIDKPESWLPAQPWTGVVLSRAFASVAAVASAPGQGEWRALAASEQTTELVGREVLLTDLAADAAAALGGATAPAPAGPAFALLVGDAGVGKTAFAGELARRVGELGARVVLATVPAPGTGKPSHSALAELVIVPSRGGSPAPGVPIVRAVGDALRAAARERPTAVILDDLHLADHDLLDALEYATLGGEPLPLWVLGVASPRIDARRPQLGTRAERHRRDALPPLDDDSAVALVATLLRPAEYPPLRALRRLAAIAHGNPLHLAMLARDLHDRGAVRERPGGAHFLDASAIDALEPVALGPWLAARELAHLSPELVALARACAALGDEIARDELAAILEAVERGGGATTTIDLDVGLRELETAGILARSARGFRFRQSLVEEGVYATTAEAERTAFHRAALARGGGGPAQVARHAEALGERAVAAAAFAQLGAGAEVEHRIIDAEIAWSSALAHLEHRDAAYGSALVGRGRARYKLQRVRDALADLDSALAVATELGDKQLEVRVLVEQATAFDWADAYDKSADAALRARAALGDLRDPELLLAIDLADARTLFRKQQVAEAVAPLSDVLARARAAGSAEIETIAGVLLVPTLVITGDLAGAQRAAADVFVACEKWGDRFHLGAAYANRAWVQSERGEIELMADDLEHVVQIARELGHAALERIGTYNLAENRLWQGALDPALALARRSLAIQLAHAEGSTLPDRMLIARVLAARGNGPELGAAIDAVARDQLGDDDAVMLAALRAAAARDAAAWTDIVPRLERLPVHPRLEMVHLGVICGGIGDADRIRFREVAARDAVWSRRLGAL